MTDSSSDPCFGPVAACALSSVCHVEWVLRSGAVQLPEIPRMMPFLVAVITAVLVCVGFSGARQE